MHEFNLPSNVNICVGATGVRVTDCTMNLRVVYHRLGTIRALRKVCKDGSHNANTTFKTFTYILCLLETGAEQRTVEFIPTPEYILGPITTTTLTRSNKIFVLSLDTSVLFYFFFFVFSLRDAYRFIFTRLGPFSSVTLWPTTLINECDTRLRTHL